MNPSAFSHVLCSLVPATFLLSIVCVRMVPSSGSVSGSGRISSKFRLPTKRKTGHKKWVLDLWPFMVDDLISYFFQHPFLVLQIITSQPAWLSSIQEPFLHLKKCSVPRMRRVPMSLELPLGIQGDWTWFCGKFIPQQLYHIYILYISYWKKARISIAILVDWRVTKNQRPSAV